MSDSDDELPLTQRKVQQKEKGAAPVAKKPAPKNVKEEDSSDDDVPLGQRKVEKPKPEKKRKSPGDGKQKGAADGAAAKAKPAPKKAPAAKKAASGTENSTKASQGTERVRKVYDMPGQTRDTPGEEDPLRRFYTSLLEQRSDSEMARRWCAMTGLLSKQDAEEWVTEQGKKKGGKSPSKQPASKRPSSAPSTKRKSTAASDDEADFKSAKKKKVSLGKDTGAEKKKKVVQPPAAVKPKKEKEDAGDSDDEVMPQAKQRKPTTTATNKTAAAAASVPRKVPSSTKRDVAFTDGGMDGSDSDDDVPLVQRMKATS